MSKIEINSKLINKTENENNIYKGLGIINKNRIHYNDNNVSVVIDLNNGIILKRKTSEYEIELNFNTLKGYYEIYEFKINIPLKIKIDNLMIEKSKFVIIYKLFNSKEFIGSYEYLLNYEVIEW